MKAIIFDNLEQFYKLENKIQGALFLKIPDYTAEIWAEPFYSVDKTKIACHVELDGKRGEAMAGIISDYEIVEISLDDEFWYEKKEIK